MLSVLADALKISVRARHLNGKPFDAKRKSERQQELALTLNGCNGENSCSPAHSCFLCFPVFASALLAQDSRELTPFRSKFRSSSNV